MLWLAIGATHERDGGLGRLLPQLASIISFTSDLERRLAGDGLGGLAHVRDLHRRILDLLGGVAPDVARAQAMVSEMVAALHGIDRTLAGLRRLKDELGRAS